MGSSQDLGIFNQWDGTGNPQRCGGPIVITGSFNTNEQIRTTLGKGKRAVKVARPFLFTDGPFWVPVVDKDGLVSYRAVVMPGILLGNLEYHIPELTVNVKKRHKY